MDFLLEIPNYIDELKCKDIINRFEKDKNKTPGQTSRGTHAPIKKSTDLPFVPHERNAWHDLDIYMSEKIDSAYIKYVNYLKNMFGESWTPLWTRDTFYDDILHTGYQIQRVDKGEYYKWHHDTNIIPYRVVGFIIYLNTLEEGEGGSTDFRVGHEKKTIKPETGKIIFFPSTWNYVHCGKEVLTDKKSKYIATGFFILSLPPPHIMQSIYR